MLNIDINNPDEVRRAGFKVLSKELGAAGFIRFMQQFYEGKGDYTKEKYDRPEMSWEEIMSEIDKLRLEREQNNSTQLA